MEFTEILLPLFPFFPLQEEGRMVRCETPVISRSVSGHFHHSLSKTSKLPLCSGIFMHITYQLPATFFMGIAERPKSRYEEAAKENKEGRGNLGRDMGQERQERRESKDWGVRGVCVSASAKVCGSQRNINRREGKLRA